MNSHVERMMESEKDSIAILDARRYRSSYSWVETKENRKRLFASTCRRTNAPFDALTPSALLLSRQIEVPKTLSKQVEKE